MAQRFPFSPFPDGWFFVCYSHELPRGKLFSKKFMGREIVAFRGASGQVCVSDAHCPHLGAHLGKRGGCIEGDAIKCPFHSFRFDETGKCVSTPYGEPPKAAKLAKWNAHEFDGFIFAYYDAEGREPAWRIPEQDQNGYSELATRYWRVRGHPQETTENGVDSGHLMTVHGYKSLEVLSPTRADGPYLTGSYTMRRDAPAVLDALDIKLDAEFHVHVWGLGYSLVETGVPNYGLWARQYIFATPSDGEYIDLHIALRVKRVESLGRVLKPLRHIPEPLATMAVRTLFMKAFENDINQDFDIWENKGYVTRPAISKADGPIGLFRRYCRQFYPDLRVQEQAAE
jgi:nitrite reductase/ring-hydroxylating ferredoxin subunit